MSTDEYGDDAFEVEQDVPFALVPSWFARSAAPAIDKVVYLVLATYAGRGRTAWPSIATIARDVSADARTVRRCLARLEESGVVERRGRASQSGAQTSNGYRLATTERASRPCHPCQGGGDPCESWGVKPVSPLYEQDQTNRTRGTIPSGGDARDVRAHEQRTPPPPTNVDDDERPANPPGALVGDPTYANLVERVERLGAPGVNVDAKVGEVERTVGKLGGVQAGNVARWLGDAERETLELVLEARGADRPAAWLGNALASGAVLDRRSAPPLAKRAGKVVEPLRSIDEIRRARRG